MMTRGIFETLLGAIVLLVALSFAGYVYSARDAAPNESYGLNLRFNNVQGLKPATEVRLGGIKIGEVEALNLDPQTLQAIVTISVDEAVRLPIDSHAEVATAGLLGGNFLKIHPGAATEYLAADAEMKKTKDPVSLEDLLGQAIFALAEK